MFGCSYYSPIVGGSGLFMSPVQRIVEKSQRGATILCNFEKSLIKQLIHPHMLIDGLDEWKVDASFLPAAGVLRCWCTSPVHVGWPSRVLYVYQVPGNCEP